MPNFEAVFKKLDGQHKTERHPTGLQPYLDLKPRRKSKSHATDPDRFWWFWCLVVIGLVLSAAKFL